MKISRFVPVFFIIIFAISFSVQASAATVSPGLQATLQRVPLGQEIPVIMTLADKEDLSRFKDHDKEVRRNKIVAALKDKAYKTQGQLKAFLRGRSAKRVKPFWITNAIAATIPASMVNELANFPGIETIETDAVVSVPPVTPSSPAVAPLAANIEWNISKINAPALWDAGITGAGAVVANVDTGVDINNASVAGTWRGRSKSWHSVFADPGTCSITIAQACFANSDCPSGEVCNSNADYCATPKHCTSCEISTTPCDLIGHGTGTMGVMVGNSITGTSIGVAPGARWIAVKIFPDPTSSNPQPGTYSSLVLDAYQWLMSLPSGGAPDVINNSFGGSPDICADYLESSLNTLRIAGIEVVFSAGNDGGPLSSGKNVATGNGIQTVFDAILAAAVRPNSINISANVITSFDTGSGGGTVFDAILAPGIRPNSVNIFVSPDTTLIGTDDGFGPIGHFIVPSGSTLDGPQSTIDYLTGALSLVFSSPPGNFVSITAQYTLGIGTDDGFGPIGHFIVPSGSTLDGPQSTIDYLTGALHVVFSSPPGNNESITTQYKFGTSGSPANNQGSFAVGATDSNNVIALFSSRGPNACDGSIFPHVVAPGVSINLAASVPPDCVCSAAPCPCDGTSFSAPHVAGAVALLVSALPSLTPDQIETAFTQTAVPLGSPIPNNDYGYGLIDVVEAYKYAFLKFVNVGNNPVALVRNSAIVATYPDIQTALANCSNLDIIKVQATNPLAAPGINLPSRIAVSLLGGYEPAFLSQTGSTTIQGTLTITTGTVVVGDVIVSK